jgi:DNA end-binding protein Ku
MAPRAYWKGYLKLSLVSCPIALYPASSSAERVSFHRINKNTGNRLKQQMVDAETGDVVDNEKIGRGYEIGRGQYLNVEDDEIEKIQIESTHTIEIDSFVPRAEIDDRYPHSPYFIAPTDQGGRHLRLSATRFRTRAWLHLVAWYSPAASMSSCLSRSTRVCWRPR